MHIPKCRTVIVAVLLLVLITAAQTQQSAEEFVIDAYPGYAKVVWSHPLACLRE